MVEIRIHGRGGQGAVSASQILASAFFLEGKYPQCFSSFGGERRGVPVVAFVRADDRRVRLRCEVTSPDQVISLDSSLVKEVAITAGLKPEGLILINSDRGAAEFPFSQDFKVYTVDAAKVAQAQGLGILVNTAILGAYARVSGVISIESVVEAMKEAVPANVKANQQAAWQAYHEVRGNYASL